MSRLGLDIMILGDLNDDCYNIESDGKNNISNICELFHLKQLVAVPTRVTATSQTLIDVILSNLNNDNHIETSVFPVTLSDHYLVYTVIAYSPRPESNILTCRTYKNFNPEAFNEDIFKAIQSLNFDEENLHTSWENFKHAFLEISNEHAPFRSFKIKGNSKPWVTGEIVDLMKNRDYLHKLAIRHNCKVTFDRYRAARNLVTSKIKCAKRSYFENDLLSSTCNQSKSIWESVKLVLGNKKSNNPVHKDIVSNELNEYFANIGQKLNKPLKHYKPIWRGPDSIYEFKFYPVHENFIRKQLAELSSRSKNDVLLFDSKLLRLSGNIIAPYITNLFNTSLVSANVLDDWKKAKVTPLYKGKGCKTDFSLYRPISVICHIAKILEKCVHMQLSSYCEIHDFITPDQSAYLKHNSTQTALLKVTNEWYHNIENGLITGVCFLDVSKCFDVISHDTLLFKMQKYGIRNIELNWFKSYL